MLINYHDAWHCLNQKIQIFLTFLVQGLRNWECWPDMAHERRPSDSGNEYVDANAVFSQVILHRNVTLIAWDSFPLLFLNYAQQAFFCCRQVFLCCRQCAWSTSLFLQLVDSHQDWINWEQMDKSSLCQRHEEEKILFCRQTLQKNIPWLVQMHQCAIYRIFNIFQKMLMTISCICWKVIAYRDIWTDPYRNFNIFQHFRDILKLWSYPIDETMCWYS